jgi:5-methylcytosine-specific restriction endonuclease McrA
MTKRLLGSRYWRRRRAMQLQREPLCRQCLKEGRTTPATVVHHRVRDENEINAFTLSPLESLCAHCHDSTMQQIEQHDAADREARLR